MNIALDGNEANIRNRVGSGTYAFELLRQFSQNKNHQFYVYLKNKPLSDLPQETKNFKYIVFGPKKLWTQFALPIKLFIDKKIDIFFTLGHYGPRFSSVKYIVTIFDLSYLHFPQLFKKNDLYQLNKWSRYSIKNASHIFAISEATKNDLIESYGVNPAKITNTYLGYDHKHFKPQSQVKINQVKKKFNINSDYILAVGTLQPRKNYSKLIESFKNITNSTKSSLKLVIAGKKGWLYEPILQKAKEIGIKDKVIFTDFVANADLPALISGAIAYVLPSLWEGFGIPAIEAQACKTPVVVSNVSSLPEVVGDSAIQVNPQRLDSITKGIKKIISNEELRKNLIYKGSQNIKRFSWEKCARETLTKIEEIASQ